MQVYRCEETLVQRNMDLARDLLLKIESDARFDGTNWIHFRSGEEMGIDGYTNEEIGYHLNLLIDAGFIKGKSGMQVIPTLNKMTWNGHEFLDNIRDKSVWEKVKIRLDGLSSVSLRIVADIAESEIKKRLNL